MSEKDTQAYTLVLEDLKRRKKALEVLISKLESFVDPSGLNRDSDVDADDPDGLALIRRLGSGSALHSGVEPSEASRSISPGKFERWTLSSAIMWILDSSSVGCSNAEILTRLAEGGFNFKSKNRAVAVAQCLKRLSDKASVTRFARGKWGRAQAVPAPARSQEGGAAA